MKLHETILLLINYKLKTVIMVFTPHVPGFFCLAGIALKI